MTEPITREELRQRVYSEFSVLLSGGGLSDEQYESLMDQRQEPIELIMRLIDNYTDSQCEARMKVAVLEGKIENMEELYEEFWPLYYSVKWERRLTQLKEKKERI